MAEGETVEESAVRLGHHRGEGIAQGRRVASGPRPVQGRHVETVAAHGFDAAVHHPDRGDVLAVEEPAHEGFVVAQHMDGLEARQGRAEQQIDDAARIRAPVDVVAQVDHDPALGARSCRVRAR